MIISWVTLLNLDGFDIVRYWIADRDGSENKSGVASTSYPININQEVQIRI